ncbi:MAG: hypothetical protein GTO05_07675, partial [Gemmatimonadales bacterium]|nr:hypothetical protein [Gemmatimonadales bacterium]NIS65023.1 hypothetical protein [Gemmatimonadales bacterium]
AEGIPVTDIDSVFRSTGDPLSLFALTWAAGHYTPEGYRLVAESIDRLVN